MFCYIVGSWEINYCDRTEQYNQVLLIRVESID